jgi:prevent-host-death family protein
VSPKKRKPCTFGRSGENLLGRGQREFHEDRHYTIRDLQKKLRECVDDVQKDRVVATRRGKPAAVLVKARLRMKK